MLLKKFSNHMLNSLKGMIEYHPRTCPLHYFSHALAHIRFITMNWTHFTCRFLFAKLTFIQTQFCIFKQLYTIGTEAFILLIMKTIKSNHQTYGLLLTLNPVHCFFVSNNYQGSLITVTICKPRFP